MDVPSAATRRPDRRRLCAPAALMVFAALLLACNREPGLEGPIWNEGQVGRRLIDALGCCSCHVIPGASNAKGMLGPSLEGFGARPYIAGTLVNNQENLVRWITDPQGIHPDTAMPAVGATERQAHAIATYLASLK